MLAGTTFVKYCPAVPLELLIKSSNPLKLIFKLLFNKIKLELWVLTCTCYALGYKDSIDIPRMFKEAEEVYDYFDIEFEQTLFDVVSAIVMMNQNNLFEDCNIVFSLCEIVKCFGTFLAALNREYGISFDDLMEYNMNKLGLRYDENGKRVDGK